MSRLQTVWRSHQHEVSSAVERLLNRSGGVIAALLLATQTTPAVTGKFTLVALFLSLFQTVWELSLRQLSPETLKRERGHRQLRKASMGAAALNGAGVLIVILVSLLLDVVSFREALALIPLAVAGVMTGLSVVRVGILQLNSRWTQLSKYQSYAVILSLVVGVPLIVFHGLIGASIQMMLCETVFALLVFRARRTYGEVVPTDSEIHRRTLSRSLAAVSSSNLAGWAQGQVERLVIALASTTALLAQYSLALSATRVFYEAGILGQLSHFRFELSKVAAGSARRTYVSRRLARAGWVALGVQLLVSVLGSLALAIVLSSEWTTAVHLVPILASTLGALTMSWFSSSALIVEGRVRSLLGVQVFGLFMSVVAGIALTHSLLLGALILVLRDVIGAAGRLWLCRANLSRTFLWSLLVQTVLAAAIASVSVPLVISGLA